MIARWMRDDILEGVQRLRPVADDLGISMGQLALAWVLKNDNVASAIVGASRPEQVAENVRAIDVELDDEALRRVEEAVGGLAERDAALTARTSPAERPA